MAAPPRPGSDAREGRTCPSRLRLRLSAVSSPRSSSGSRSPPLGGSSNSASSLFHSSPFSSPAAVSVSKMSPPMCRQVPPDLDNLTPLFLYFLSTRFPASADLSVEDAEIFRKRTQELDRLIRLPIRQLSCLLIDCLQLKSSGICSNLWMLMEKVLELHKKVKQAYSYAVSNFVFFSISSVIGEIYIKIGSHWIWPPNNLRLNHPLLQMVLFARSLNGNSFAYLKSKAPKGVALMAERLGSSASPTEYIADWIPVSWKSESPDALRNLPCRSKKPLLQVLFNISGTKKPSSTVSGDNVKSGPYDSSMTAAEWNCGVSNMSSLEPGKAGNQLSYREESNNCQQHGALTGSSHDTILQVPMAQEVACVHSISLEKMPTAASSVRCGDAYESGMLAKQTSPQEQFVLNSSRDGGSGNPHSNSVPRVTPFADTAFTPMVPEHIEVDRHHLRKNGLALEDDTLKADYIFIHMMVGSHGISADRSMQYIIILDSGASYHCTGDRSQLSDYCDGVAPVAYLLGAGGTLMRVHGTGSIHNENFQVKGVLYVPGLNYQPNISKTIFSVSKLNELGLSVLFNPDGTAFIMNLEREIIGKARKVRGQFIMDYLRIPDNRAPMVMLEGRGPGLVRSLRRASLSVWSSITGILSQRTTYTQRPPV